jgi:AcrR family transcriptional regulator
VEAQLLKSQGLREKKNAQAKRALYDAAIKLFREKGFDAASVDEIAELAGFSRATFFNHFGSKQGVLRYYGQEIRERVEEMIAEAAPHVSPRELIRKVIVAMAREAEEHREELRLIYSYSIRDADYLFDPTPARKRLFELVSDLVDRGQKCGEIRQDMAAENLASLVLSVYWGLILAIISQEGEAKSLLHSAWQFILGGVRGDGCSTRQIDEGHS